MNFPLPHPHSLRWADPSDSLPLDFDTTPSAELHDKICLLARRILDGRHPGILTTVNAEGRPRARWMATVSFQAFPYLYTLTSPRSRKLDELAAHPEVTWLFANHNLTTTFTLEGRASEIMDPDVVRDVWNAIEDKHRAYFLRFDPGVTVIGTLVESVECDFPEKNIHVDCSIADLESVLQGKAG